MVKPIPPSGRNCLTVAVMMDRGGVAEPKALIEKGLDPLHPNADGSTPLQWAAYCGKLDQNARPAVLTLSHALEGHKGRAAPTHSASNLGMAA